MIYISLTTVPDRLSHWNVLSRNLDALLHQNTDKEYYVILSIPPVYRMVESMEYIIPPELLKLIESDSKLIINRKTPDYGPIVKIVGALEFSKDPNDIIIVCDDDHIYHKDMLEYHVKKINQHPNSAICFRGDCGLEKRDWTDPKDGLKKYVLLPGTVYFPVNRDSFLLVPGHWHSVSYRRSFFKEDFNEELFSLADGDDIIMGYYLKKHQLFARCVMWEGETNFIPLNTFIEAPVHSFPIIEELVFPFESGGRRIRKKHENDSTILKGTHGRESKELSDFINQHNIIYIEKIQ